jgi:hypothetical protein
VNLYFYLLKDKKYLSRREMIIGLTEKRWL